jgi:hypothetical protein
MGDEEDGVDALGCQKPPAQLRVFPGVARGIFHPAHGHAEFPFQDLLHETGLRCAALGAAATHQDRQVTLPRKPRRVAKPFQGEVACRVATIFRCVAIAARTQHDDGLGTGKIEAGGGPLLQRGQEPVCHHRNRKEPKAHGGQHEEPAGKTRPPAQEAKAEEEQQEQIARGQEEGAHLRVTGYRVQATGGRRIREQASGIKDQGSDAVGASGVPGALDFSLFTAGVFVVGFGRVNRKYLIFNDS